MKVIARKYPTDTELQQLLQNVEQWYCIVSNEDFDEPFNKRPREEDPEDGAPGASGVAA